MSDRFFVITGGPGSGKTTLIEALAAAGFASAPEAGRAIIQDQVMIGGRALPWADPGLFAELMLAADLRTYRAQPADGVVVFDRGIPDVAGYLTLTGLPVPEHVAKAARVCRYNRRVFICPPWPEIYTGDSERKQSLEEAERTYAAMAAIYRDYDYELVEAPRRPVVERVAFVRAVIEA
ncbi:AAA family ATPase [Chelatococcus sp. GCM10030263]|uniref:AAA family ATPase n=1 Tax=Chelatococcus sp. GCM10030263 TaxID=3273387 RepID=UPI00360AE2DB